MSNPQLVPGLSLNLRKRTELSGAVLEHTLALDLDRHHTSINLTFSDAKGISFYLRRHNGSSDIHAFCEHGIWQHYFEPGAAVNMAYAGTKHVERRFPTDFV